jgi:hypothetical protein
MGAFEGSSGCECPARAAVSLVFDIGDSATVYPINVSVQSKVVEHSCLRIFLEHACCKLGWFGCSCCRKRFVGKYRLVFLFLPIGEVIVSQLVSILVIPIPRLDLDINLCESFSPGLEITNVIVGLAMLRQIAHKAL